MYIQWFRGVVLVEWATSPEELVEKANWPADLYRERAMQLAREEIADLQLLEEERDMYLDIAINWL